jgi:AbrB family looped-hinge helix DNA binding protein
MRVTIDQSGRLVIPKPLRDEVGLTPGASVELTVDGAGMRIEPITSSVFVERDGFFVIPGPGARLTDDQVRELRLADQA